MDLDDDDDEPEAPRGSASASASGEVAEKKQRFVWTPDLHCRFEAAVRGALAERPDLDLLILGHDLARKDTPCAAAAPYRCAVFTLSWRTRRLQGRRRS